MNWQVSADALRVGDRWRSLGAGYIGRTISTVSTGCNCQGRSRTMVPGTGGPMHYRVVTITAEGLTGHLPASALVTLTDGY